MTRRHRLGVLFAWLLGAACIVLAWVIYDELDGLSASEVPDSAEAGSSAALTPPQPQAAPAVPDKAALSAIVERPVFSQTRRPSSVPGGVSATSMDFALLGVVISEGERSALVRPGKSEIVQQLKEGEEIAGWTVVAIAPDRVLVRRDTVEAEVFLDYAAPAPPMPRTDSRAEKPAKEPAPQQAPEQTPNPNGDPEGETDGEPEN